tara:strand:- start:377 stop:1147 length:771 start_codon:yes stop_codon:yes gene_type:complete
MNLSFEKYQASGNDFILINQYNNNFLLNKKRIKFLCDRNLGVGADGLIIFRNTPTADFEIKFYNPDGSESFCGNGSRCAVHFAISNKISKKNFSRFLAKNKYHEAFVNRSKISIKMNNISNIKKIDNDYYVDLESPHYVRFCKDLNNLDFNKNIKNIKLNYNPKYGLFNINLIQIINKNEISVRTFEKGVEGETLSCGTGAIASSIAASFKKCESPLKINYTGGSMKVRFTKNINIFENIYLEGSQNFVYSGKIKI